MINSLRNELKKYKAVCKEGCFSCCRQINFTQEERAVLVKACPTPPRGKGNDHCEYLSKEGKCSVYRDRPIICRAFGVVDTPLLTCNLVQIDKKMPFTKELREYGKKCTEQNNCEDEFMKRLKSGDPNAVLVVMKQIAQLHLDGVLTKEEFIERINYYKKGIRSNLIEDSKRANF